MLRRNTGRARRNGAQTRSFALPVSLISSVSPVFYVQADLGVTLDTGVARWADLSGQGNDFTQATGGAQPAYLSRDTSMGNQPSITGDGVDDILLTATYSKALPLWYWFIIRQITWGLNRTVFGSIFGGSPVNCVFSSVSSPVLSQQNGTPANSNGGAVLGRCVRGEALFSHTTADYLKLGAAIATGADAGPDFFSATAMAIFARSDSAGFANCSFGALGCWSGLPTADERAALDKLAFAKWGADI